MLTYSVKSVHSLWDSQSHNENHRITLWLPCELCTGWNVLKTVSFFFFAGKPDIALKGDACYKDFIVIPNPVGDIRTDRFCGNALIPTMCKYPELFI